jgi:uncharacterized protein YbjT (DUF2867 family)
LRSAGQLVRVLSRKQQEAADGVEYVIGDLATGEGVDAAVEGVQIIVHCAGTAKGDEVKTQHLVRAATLAGSPHIVYISVVGADRVPVISRTDRAMFGYFKSKLASEQIIQESGLPWTILRATQFHEAILKAAKMMAKMPVVMAPSRTRFQPIAAGEVAGRLVELALGEPAGMVPEMGGPAAYQMKDLIRGYLRVARRHRPIVSMRMPGNASRAFRDGANLTPNRAVGVRSWEDFLTASVRS